VLRVISAAAFLSCAKQGAAMFASRIGQKVVAFAKRIPLLLAHRATRGLKNKQKERGQGRKLIAKRRFGRDQKSKNKI